MAENLLGALNTAMQICWDETHGYTIGGNMNPDTDCSGLVWYALYNNGFNVGSTRFDTTSEGRILRDAGFTEYVYTPSFTPQHGDIFMYDEGGGANGHTFFYAENVYGYTDSTGRSNSKGVLQHAKIEASSSRESGYQYPNDPNTQPGDVNNPDQPGDYPRNGVGAYWEVWVHAYSSLVYGSHTWYVYRWGGTPPPPPPHGRRGHLPIWLINKIIRKEL